MLGQHRRQHICREVVVVLHRREDGFAADLIPRVVMMCALALCSRSSATDGLQLLLAHALRAAEQDGAGVFNLVDDRIRRSSSYTCRHLLASATVTKLPISASGTSVSTSCTARMTSQSLPTPRRLDEDAVRMILVASPVCSALPKSPTSDAADAAGVHLRHLNTGLLHEAAVDTDFAELVFNEDDFLAGKRLFKAAS